MKAKARLLEEKKRQREEMQEKGKLRKVEDKAKRQRHKLNVNKLQ